MRAQSYASRLRAVVSLFISLGLLTAGCQTPAWRSFDQVKIGHDKSVVVETIGSPTKTRRWQGKDRWVYEFGDHPNGAMVREIVFEDGRVIYTGVFLLPNVNANEQDKLNESSNQQHQHTLNEDQERRDRRVGISRVRRDSDQSQPEAIDPAEHKLRESIYGIEPNPTLEKRKRAPVFVPVD
jgi:outer membrane protein assembly factor BamE